MNCVRFKNVWKSTLFFYVLSWLIYLNSSRIKKKTHCTIGVSVERSTRSVRGQNGLLNHILVLIDDSDGNYDGNDDGDYEAFFFVSELLILQYTSWHDTSACHTPCCLEFDIYFNSDYCFRINECEFLTQKT